MEIIKQFIQETSAWVEHYPVLAALVGSAILVLIALVGNFILKRVLVRAFLGLLQKVSNDPEIRLIQESIVKRVANALPAFIISLGIVAVPNLHEAFVTIVKNVSNAFIILTIALALTGILKLLNSIYNRRPDAARKPIKGYIQVISIVVYVIAAILIVATLIDRSPLILLSGLGALAAVLMLVFQDTLLSLVASIQISSGDMIRVGDWVEMPSSNADGDVLEIALHTVKIQNWDKTITMVPIRNFITNGFINWRGMQESGGRRIKRSLMLDQQSVGFLTTEQIEKLKKFRLLHDYFDTKLAEIDVWNKNLNEAGKFVVNTRRVTNIGTFRAYVQKYLENHPGIHQGMTLLVRQLNPTSDGLPLEIYTFTNTVAWAAYEGIQSDIFDHLLAILPEFGLSVYQHPSGRDVTQLAGVLQNKNIQ